MVLLKCWPCRVRFIPFFGFDFYGNENSSSALLCSVCVCLWCLGTADILPIIVPSVHSIESEWTGKSYPSSLHLIHRNQKSEREHKKVPRANRKKPAPKHPVFRSNRYPSSKGATLLRYWIVEHCTWYRILVENINKVDLAWRICVFMRFQRTISVHACYVYTHYFIHFFSRCS